MKKLLFSTLLISMFALIAIPSSASSTIEDPSDDRVETLRKNEVKELNKEEAQERVDLLTERLKEIKSLDVDDYSWNERRKLKKEVRDIEKELKWHQQDAAIYISGGALLIIILLIILL